MNRFIMADASACIGCRTCEVACVVSHQEQQNSAAVTTADFVPRIRVIKEDSFTTATVCHQCEDAPCANVCPVQAIRRDRGHIFVTPSRCIGCKSCMLACPFGAMTVVASASGAQAIKCDLCWHREAGPACVEACPTLALQCVDATHVQRQRLYSQPF
ncbi:TPA: 4Fe-4S dicluster domain-containing protein [Salmonella enterica]|uniref:4Fe-4S dicluster domain-containing protein n=2 Tax=Salmonella enterica TaxID=28901 RepID=A0A3V8I2W1_SALER|nr:4Fe-4S dicluster domain-containing protein [Salmonella enterica]ECC9158472.1 electron transporter [Salmonella enterica subsp. salamae]HCM1850631.1 4Fe-4S binding protein [Salmonella enterica subsp. salamae serovar 42:z29:-]AZT22593.1 4Fe-4S dicluster domain-containing protein [Salmonella enterica subsp. salamae serovar 42:r:-]AZT49023.1 4Fe-4S dicluster domain-containing protein [Salmonella enterica subsp. salamae serovar 42:r:-]AZT53254.1 4Fe-4S dicluster domain-containing protein [Salmone